MSFEFTLALKMDFPIPGPARSMYIRPGEGEEVAAVPVPPVGGDVAGSTPEGGVRVASE